MHRMIIVVRHGEAEHNVAKIYNSNPNHERYSPSNLTAKGRKQLVETGEKLNLFLDKNSVDIAFTSPLPRASQSIEVLSHSGFFANSVIQVDNRLTEVQMGEREGLPHHQFLENDWENAQVYKYKGESMASVHLRIQNFYRYMLSQSQKHTLIVTHGGPAQHLLKLMGNTANRLQPGEFALERLPYSAKRK